MVQAELYPAQVGFPVAGFHCLDHARSLGPGQEVNRGGLSLVEGIGYLEEFLAYVDVIRRFRCHPDLH